MARAEPPIDTASRALEWVRRRDPGLGAEVFVFQGMSRSVELREGRLETTQEAGEEGMSLRLLRDGRMAFAFSGETSPRSWPALYEMARAQLPMAEPDPCRVLPGPGPHRAPKGLASSLFDPALFAVPLQERVPGLREVHDRAMSADPRVGKVLRIGYEESEGEMAVASTAGVRTSERGTSCSVGLSVLAGSGGDLQVGTAYRTARLAKELDIGRVAGEAVSRAVPLLGSRKLPTRRRAVLFDPWVAGEVLELLAGPMSAEAVQRGKSLLKGKLGRRVASEKVTFVDDPQLPGGAASARFDDEGVPTRYKRMVDRGILKDYFFDSYTARRDGRESNGCAGRAGFKGLPGATFSNFYLEPGALSRDKLLAGTRDGLLVFEVMGMHTADPISGEISVGVSGVAVRDGEVAHGVRGALLSGDLLGLLDRVDAVADDLVFYGSLAAPTFRVADVVIA